jgi:putative ABC transport system permease protein
MSAWHLMLRNIRHRKSLSLLTAAAVAVTVLLFVLLLLVRDGLEQGAAKGYGPFEIVVGADGSESQLVLNTFYRVGAPTGNIPYSVLEELEREPDAAAVFGLTVGDNYNNFPIIGIDPGYFASRYEDRKLAQGSLYSGIGEVTVGYDAAKALGLKLGDEFHGAHGILGHAEDMDAEGHAGNFDTDRHGEKLNAEEHAKELEKQNATEAEHGTAEVEHGDGEPDEHNGHDEHESFVYRVVGILPRLGTADDRALFTTMDHAWAVHHVEDAADKEVTAVLIKPGTLLAAQSLKQKYDALDNVQAVYSSKAVADLLNMADTGAELVAVLLVFCVVLAAVTLILSLLAAVQERRRDAGLLRLIGKSKAFILGLIIGEGTLLTAAGLISGSVLGHLAAWATRDTLFTRTGIQIVSGTWASGEGLLVLLTIGVGTLAAVLPALRIYRIDALALFKQG